MKDLARFMKDLPRFIKLGNERINIDEIVSYGIAIGWDEDEEEEYRYIYVETKTSDELFEYVEGEDDVDFDLDDKLAELDALFLSK